MNLKSAYIIPKQNVVPSLFIFGYMLEVNFESFICLGAQVDSHFEMVVFYA